jgi:hypothetical protein
MDEPHVKDIETLNGFPILFRYVLRRPEIHTQEVIDRARQIEEDKTLETSLKAIGEQYNRELTEAEDSMFNATVKLKTLRKILEAAKPVWNKPFTGYIPVAFHCENVDEARQVIGALLDSDLPIVSFEKMLSSVVRENKEPEWYWLAELPYNPKSQYSAISIMVYPATPDENCTPKLDYSEPWTPGPSWTCERRDHNERTP